MWNFVTVVNFVVMENPNSPLVKDLQSTPTQLVMLNQVMNLAICLAADPVLNYVSRDILSGVAASVSLVIENFNRSRSNG